jgi:hypothetical protein
VKALKILNQFSSFKALNQQLEQYTKNQQTKLAGDVFELAVKLYLQTNPKYRTKLKNVWLLAVRLLRAKVAYCTLVVTHL